MPRARIHASDAARKRAWNIANRDRRREQNRAAKKRLRLKRRLAREAMEREEAAKGGKASGRRGGK